MIPIRIQRKRTKGWRKPDNTIYVGRGSKWGNPWTIKEIIESGLFKPGYATTVAVEEYEAWLTKNVSPYDEHLGRWQELVKEREWILENIHTLKGKNLMCWCKIGEEPCHADILLKIANGE